MIQWWAVCLIMLVQTLCQLAVMAAMSHAHESEGDGEIHEPGSKGGESWSWTSEH